MWLDMCFPNDQWCSASRHVLIGHLHIFCGEMFFHVLCPLFDEVVCFVLLNVGVPYTFWILTPYQTHDLRIFSPLLWAALSPCWFCPLSHGRFHFDRGQFTYFSYVAASLPFRNLLALFAVILSFILSELVISRKPWVFWTTRALESDYQG